MQRSFKNVVSISEKTNDQLLEVIEDFTCFSLDQYGDILIPKTEEYLDQFPISEKEKEYYFPYYYWWAVFCSRSLAAEKKTVYELYLQDNSWKFKKKHNLERVLSSWKFVFPSFFFIEEMATERIFCLVDVFDYFKYKPVVLTSKLYTQPSSKDAFTGLILPLAGGGYFTVVDFLIIPEHLKAPLMSKLMKFCQNHKVIPPGVVLSKYYPEMLKITIDHLIKNKVEIPHVSLN
ncbi:hypothetical protein [Cytobacillus gottheilii]|uniref:Uncharacterized protein n=1 Tax=Cytobacillus gottheilii TaxID=859144 RepID=A0ABX8FCK9_9BACI|nr:hypothetical protein [Cytobacillus gottheilii]QVY62098.1 hypothetical protein J1899_03015 [Cytobacillus gottheilii]